MNETRLQRAHGSLLRSIILLAILATLGALPGCASGKFRGSDDSVLMPGFRIQAEVSPGRRRDGAGDPGLGGEVHAGYLQTVEADLQTMRGDDGGTFGQDLEIGSTVFPAGTALDADFRLTSASAFATSGFRTETGLEFSTLYGIEYTSLDFEATGGGLHGRNDHKEFGALIGIRLRWLIDERFRLYASSRASFLRFSFEQNEIGLEYRFVPRLAVYSGFRRAEYNLDDGDDSELDLVWKGLVVGLQLEF